MKLALTALISLSAAFCSPARADVSIWAHGVSWHHTARENGIPWNEKNWGAGVRYNFNQDWSVQVGAYKNSYSRKTEYALFQWQPVGFKGIRAGIFGGYASGYDSPAIAGFLATVPVTDRLALGLRFIPKVKDVSPGVTAIEIGWRF